MRGDLRLGLVGCGRLAERGYVPALAHVPDLRLAAVADPVLERCARVAPGVPAFASAAALVAADAADALVLATPAAAHVADARLAANAGLPALIEKPPARTLAEAIELAALDPAPRFGFNRRFVPTIARLRPAVPSPVELALELHARSSAWGSHDADDDALLNLGSHVVDLARWLSGADIARVRAALTRSRAVLELELADGRGRARLTCAADRPYRERVVVDGRSRYSAGGPAAALGHLLRGKTADHPLVPSLARQLDAFGRAVRGEPEPALAGAHDGVAVMAALEAARASAAHGGEWAAAS